MSLITLLTCHVRSDEARLFIKKMNCRNIVIKQHYFYASIKADSGEVHMTGVVINAYAKYYLVNKNVIK